MALIPCKNCGKEISDKATVCPNCGYPIQAQQDETPQKVSITAIELSKMKQSDKKKIVSSICLVAAIVILFFVGQKVYNTRQGSKYSANLLLASSTMLTGAADAESVGNLTRQVWYDSIYEEYNLETAKYTQPNGFWVDDFNTALRNLFSDGSFQSRIEEIEENQELVSSIMKELKNPPEGYEDAYAAIKSFYDAYLTLTNLAVNPTGSLQTFTANFNDADSEVLNQYNAMKLYLD